MEQTTFDRVNEERRELISDIVRSVLAQVIPQVKAELTAGYLDQITEIVNRRFDELDSASEQRHDEFVKQTETRLSQVATKEELRGVTKAGADNTGRIDKLEAATDARLKLLEDGFKSLNESDKQHKKDIKNIGDSATSTAQNAQKTSEAVISLIGQFKTWRTDTDREITSLKDKQAVDEKALRLAQEDMLSNRAELNDMKTTLATETDRARNRVISIADKVDGALNVQHAHEEKLEALAAQQSRVNAVLANIEWVIGSVRWLFKERRGNVVLALLLSFFVGFQVYYAILSHNLNQRYNELIPVIIALQSALK